MKLSDFDRIIKQKVSQENTLYQKEIENSRPFVWREIEPKETGKIIVVPWYYSVAAVILFLLASSWFFFNLQKQHQQQIQLLSKQINGDTNRYSFNEAIQIKNEQLNLACKAIDSLERRNHLLQNKPIEQTFVRTNTIYQTDTVFITKIEYITEYISPIQQKGDILNTDSSISPKPEIVQSSSLIYPDFTASTIKKSADNPSIKLRVSALTIK